MSAKHYRGAPQRMTPAMEEKLRASDSVLQRSSQGRLYFGLLVRGRPRRYRITYKGEEWLASLGCGEGSTLDRGLINDLFDFGHIENQGSGLIRTGSPEKVATSDTNTTDEPSQAAGTRFSSSRITTIPKIPGLDDRRPSVALVRPMRSQPESPTTQLADGAKSPMRVPKRLQKKAAKRAAGKVAN